MFSLYSVMYDKYTALRAHPLYDSIPVPLYNLSSSLHFAVPACHVPALKAHVIVLLLRLVHCILLRLLSCYDIIIIHRECSGCTVDAGAPGWNHIILCSLIQRYVPGSMRASLHVNVLSAQTVTYPRQKLRVLFGGAGSRVYPTSINVVECEVFKQVLYRPPQPYIQMVRGIERRTPPTEA
ncbi:hypothetical protein OH76DRAFT_905168 [Lentinus brumalis]|uniref:Uncharacterized protein n=1 Tax=Lentinus brumalis TaxID=2498619 RepID=A0A371D0N9_9APHY|nr:hypothetical protein OH76DRAFT_905168 [Polyporus brumalis]